MYRVGDSSVKPRCTKRDVGTTLENLRKNNQPLARGWGRTGAARGATDINPWLSAAHCTVLKHVFGEIMFQHLRQIGVSLRDRTAGWPIGWIARLGVSAVVLAVLFMLLPTDALWRAFGKISFALWGMVLVCFLAGHVVAAYKWWLLTDAGISVPFSRGVRAHFAGLVANLCLPGVAGGDVVRAGILFGDAQNRSRVVVGSLIDRLADSFGLLVISGGAFVYLGSTVVLADMPQVTNALLAVVLTFAAVGAGLAAACVFLPAILGKFDNLPARDLLVKVYSALQEMLRTPVRILFCFGLSISIQCCFIALNVALAQAVGLEVSPVVWFFAWPLAKLIAVVPISVAGLGVREAGLAALVTPFGAEAALVVAAGLIWQSILFAGGLLGGAALFLAPRFGARVQTSGADDLAPAAAAPMPLYTDINFSAADVMTPQAQQNARRDMDFETSPATSAGADSVAAKPKVAVLGAGPAGAAAAMALARDSRADTVLIERAPHVGGNAASFQIEGIWCDYGSHRLHPVADERVLSDIKSLLGEDLLLRPRHGRIRLQNRWIHFPLKPVDLLLKLPKAFTLSLAFDTIKKALPSDNLADPTFASVLRDGLGPTMSEAFYYPYVRKLWGLPPEELAVTLAHKRVSGSSVLKILHKIARQLPGLKTATSGKFYYPRKGFGQIITGLTEAAVAAGTELHLNTNVEKITRHGTRVTGVTVSENGERRHVETDAVWSTLPISMAVRLMDPPAPADVLAAAEAIKFRGMILIYLVLDTDQFSEFDAHYFPELAIPMSRMSEPKNYSASSAPEGRTLLCAELPCDPGEAYWQMSDDELGAQMCQWLEAVGLPVTVPVVKTLTRRLGFAYPVYDRAFEDHFEKMDNWLSSLDGFLSYGRQGLFAHDNTHHAMAMAYAACDCLAPDGSFNKVLWAAHREAFQSHVVED